MYRMPVSLELMLRLESDERMLFLTPGRKERRWFRPEDGVGLGTDPAREGGGAPGVAWDWALEGLRGVPCAEPAGGSGVGCQGAPPGASRRKGYALGAAKDSEPDSYRTSVTGEPGPCEVAGRRGVRGEHEVLDGVCGRRVGVCGRWTVFRDEGVARTGEGESLICAADEAVSDWSDDEGAYAKGLSLRAVFLLRSGRDDELCADELCADELVV